MPLLVDQILHGRYRITALLAQGGMGNIYRAWDLRLKLPVALKENLETSLTAQAQFEQEALMLARLSHPNLPRVTDYFSIPGQSDYLVMDYIEGEDCQSLLDTLLSLASAQTTPATDPSSTPGLPIHQVFDWIEQVCKALIYMHGQNPPVIHRDIKPSNIKITPDGKAILVDFGIAKNYSSDQSTLTGAQAVTQGYSPPEQYGSASTDARSDIYALGATLYHLLTGQKPPESVKRMTGTARLTPPSQINPGVPARLDAILLKALALPIEERYQSVADFYRALHTAYPSSREHASKTQFSANLQGEIPQSTSIPQQSTPQPSGTANLHPTKTPASAGIYRPQASLPVPPGSAPPSSRPTSQPRTAIVLPPTGKPSYLPLYLLGGFILVVLLIISGRFFIRNSSYQDSTQTGVILVTATDTFRPVLPSLTPPSRVLTPLAAIDQAKDQTAPTPLITPSLPGFPAIFYDSFQIKKYDWLTGQKGNLGCWIGNGLYWCQVPAGTVANAFIRAPAPDLHNEFILAADIRFVNAPEGASAGVTFRDTPAGRYLFSIRDDGAFRISSIQENPSNWLNLVKWTFSEAVKPGESNQLLISGNGFRYHFFINQVYVAALENDQWPYGGSGLHIFASATNQPALFVFDNYQIQQKK